MKKLVLAFLLVTVLPVLAQSTTVSATITDTPDGTVWAGGTYQIFFVPNSSVSNDWTQYTWTGGSLATKLLFKGSLDASGAFSVAIPDNTAIAPSGTTWQFIICPKVSSAMCPTTTLSVSGGSQSLSTQLSAIASSPRFQAGPSTYGYTDTEVLASTPGSRYYNVTNNVTREYNGSTWTNSAPFIRSFTVCDSPAIPPCMIYAGGQSAAIGATTVTLPSILNGVTCTTTPSACVVRLTAVIHTTAVFTGSTPTVSVTLGPYNGFSSVTSSTLDLTNTLRTLSSTTSFIADVSAQQKFVYSTTFAGTPVGGTYELLILVE